jgi:hypothetical protein
MALHAMFCVDNITEKKIVYIDVENPSTQHSIQSNQKLFLIISEITVELQNSNTIRSRRRFDFQVVRLSS